MVQTKAVNFKDFLQCKPLWKNQVLFKNIDRIQGFYKTTIKIQDFFKIVRTMYYLISYQNVLTLFITFSVDIRSSKKSDNNKDWQDMTHIEQYNSLW